MFVKILATAALTLGATAAFAENFDVQMLNRGEEGAMVFEPAYVNAAVGDTITFLAVDRGHNVEAIEGMLPEGVEVFKGTINEEYVLTLTQEGLYGIKCTPHYSMGMVALIQAGEATNLDEAAAVRHRGKARQRFAPLFELVQ